MDLHSIENGKYLKNRRFLSPQNRPAFQGRISYRNQNFQEIAAIETPRIHGLEDNVCIPMELKWCGKSRNWEGWQQKRKNFPFLSIEIITAGNGLFEEGQEQFLVEKGDVVLKKPGSNHFFCTGPKGFMHKRYLAVEGELVDLFLRNTGLHIKKVVQLPDILSLIKLWKMVYNEGKKSDSTQFSVTTYCYGFLMELARQTRIKPFPKRISRIMDYLQENNTKKLRLEQVARYANLSIPHLNTLFQQYLGKSPIEYHLEQKFERAKQMLLDQDLTISQVANLMGFESGPYFSSSFRKKYGVSPRQFRQGIRPKF